MTHDPNTASFAHHDYADDFGAYSAYTAADQAPGQAPGQAAVRVAGPGAPLDWREGTTESRSEVGQALELGRSRLLVTAAVVVLAFSAISMKLVDAMVLTDGAEPRTNRVASAELPASGRSDVVDRNGNVLATSLAVWAVHADPALMVDVREAVTKLTSVFPELDAAELTTKLSSDKRFVYIKRGLTPMQKEQVFRLGIPGVEFEREVRRIYPTAHLFSHVVGFTGIDNSGLMGVEQKFDKRLRTDPDPVRLSLDVRVQHILRRELGKQIDEFSAIGGAGMVYDVDNGEVVAMVSLPDFDPQDPTGLDDNTRFNKNTLGVYEMGSTFKIFNSAMSLDSGRVRLGDSFDVSHPIQSGRFRISDYHTHNGWLTVSEIFRDSSNIGSAKMALTAGIATQQAFMEKVGFTRPTPVELPEVARPLVPHPWREINAMTIAFGHGISVSPMHTVSAAAGTINGGIMHSPTILKRAPGDTGSELRIISEKTSDSMRKMFRFVVTDGTGKSAEVPGYVVGGKTGTADKQKGRGYARNSRMSSFVGAFPMQDPRYIAYIMVDEPKGTKKTYGFATGGWVAAPAVGRIIRQIAPLLGIPPVDEQSNDIRTALAINPVAPLPQKESVVAAVPTPRRPH